MKAPRCPRCGSADVMPHCIENYLTNPCDLLVCEQCGGRGTPDGSRWIESTGVR